MSTQQHPPSEYLNYLPAIFQDEETSPFLGYFLLAFEKMLHGLPKDDAQRRTRGLDQIIDHIHEYFDPHQTPDSFIPWLGNWVALSLRDDWSMIEKRRFISRVVPLYRYRGTLDGLKQMLLIYLNAQVYDNDLISEDDLVRVRVWDYPMQVGVVASLGEDTVVGEPLPHYFEVRVRLTDPTYVDFKRKESIARAIIEQEKPAHTTYKLIVETPTLQVGRFSTIGFDTLLEDDD